MLEGRKKYLEVIKHQTQEKVMSLSGYINPIYCKEEKKNEKRCSSYEIM
jgi:hypothetical protein